MLFVALMSVYTKGKKLGKYTHFFPIICKYRVKI